MFTEKLEFACHLHAAIIDQVAKDILDWAVPIKEAAPVLQGLGYNQVEIMDGIRLLKDTNPEAEYDETEIDTEWTHIPPLLREYRYNKSPEVQAWLRDLRTGLAKS